MSNIHYNFEKDITYSNNKEYRALLREVFYMDISSCAVSPDDVDEETFDELLYDEAKVSLVMNQIFCATIDDPIFQKLYDIAASKMLSENREIGQAVLFSYDYLPLYHRCLVAFLRTLDWNENNADYNLLLKKIT